MLDEPVDLEELAQRYVAFGLWRELVDLLHRQGGDSPEAAEWLAAALIQCLDHMVAIGGGRGGVLVALPLPEAQKRFTVVTSDGQLGPLDVGAYDDRASLLEALRVFLRSRGDP